MSKINIHSSDNLGVVEFTYLIQLINGAFQEYSSTFYTSPPCTSAVFKLVDEKEEDFLIALVKGQSEEDVAREELTRITRTKPGQKIKALVLINCENQTSEAVATQISTWLSDYFPKLKAKTESVWGEF